MIESAGPASPESLVARGLGVRDAAGGQPAARRLQHQPVRPERAVQRLPRLGHHRGRHGRQHVPDRQSGSARRCAARCRSPTITAASKRRSASSSRCGDAETQGEGQFVDVSLQETMVMPNMTSPTQFPLTGFKGGRIGGGFRGGKALLPRAVAVRRRLRLLRPARRAGAHPGHRRDGQVHGRVRHGAGGAQGTRLVDVQPQPGHPGRRSTRSRRRWARSSPARRWRSCSPQPASAT